MKRKLKQTGEKIKHYETLFLNDNNNDNNNNFVSGRQTGTLKQKLKRWFSEKTRKKGVEQI